MHAHCWLRPQPCCSQHGMKQQTLVLVHHWRSKSVIFGCLLSKEPIKIDVRFVQNMSLLKWQKVSGNSPYQPGNGWYGELCCAQVGFSSTPSSQITLTLLVKCACKCVEGNTWSLFFEQHTFVLVWTFFTLAKNYWHGFSTGVTVFIFNSNASIAVLDIKPIKWFKNNISWSNGAFCQALEIRGSKWN